jgi:hypothetical protein
MVLSAIALMGLVKEFLKDIHAPQMLVAFLVAAMQLETESAMLVP